MATLLQHYTTQFQNLPKRDRTRNYDGVALGGAPHQPVILLVLLDLYAHEPSRLNFIALDDLLLELWAIYKGLLGITSSSSAAMPVYALRSASFWHLVSRPGAPTPTERVRNRKLFHAHFVGVVVDDELHRLLQKASSRDALRQAVIEAHFPSERWLAIENAPKALVNSEFATSAYARRLLVDPSFSGSGEMSAETAPYRSLRDSSFRKAVTFAYDYRCAFCGVRLKSPRSHTLVEAAHIVPWCKTQDDRPQNGLCLCPLCHWAFDAKMLAVGADLTILSHARLQMDGNIPGHLATIQGRPIFKPKEPRYLPAPECLQEHLREFHSASPA